MLDKTMPSGYDLYNPFGTDQWVIDLKNGVAFYGVLNDIVTYMVSRLGFDSSEIQAALNAMMDCKDNSAHFGSLKSFIYTFDKVIDLNEKAS